MHIQAKYRKDWMKSEGAHSIWTKVYARQTRPGMGFSSADYVSSRAKKSYYRYKQDVDACT